MDNKILCPFRHTTIEEFSHGKKIAFENFGLCYKEQCPFYDEHADRYCLKAIAEMPE